MVMPRVVVDDGDDDDGSVPREAVRRRSSPDIRKLTMPLDRICLGVEIIIISMRHHHGQKSRIVNHGIFDSGAAPAKLCWRDQIRKTICLFHRDYYIESTIDRWLARSESAPTEFLPFIELRIHHQLPTPTLQLGKRQGRKKFHRRRTLLYFPTIRAELRNNVNHLKHSAGRDNFQADTKGTWDGRGVA